MVYKHLFNPRLLILLVLTICGCRQHISSVKSLEEAQQIVSNNNSDWERIRPLLGPYSGKMDYPNGSTRLDYDTVSPSKAMDSAPKDTPVTVGFTIFVSKGKVEEITAIKLVVGKERAP